MAGILTDALGVLAIAIVAIPALRQLAVTATLWLLSLIVTELLLNPIVYSPSAGARSRQDSRARARDVRPRPRAARPTACSGRAVDGSTLAGGAVCSCRSSIAAPSLDPGSATRNPARAFSPPMPSTIAAIAPCRRRSAAASRSWWWPRATTAKALQDAGVLRTIESFQRYLERTPVVGASFSLVDILKSMGQLFHELEPKWAVIPTSRREIATMFFTYWGSVSPSTSAQYFTPDFSTAHITFFCRDHTLEHVRGLVAAARAFIAAHPLEHVRFRLAGGFVGIMAAVYDEILRSQALMTAASFLVIFAIVRLTYRSLVAAVLLVLPLALANVARERVHGGARHRPRPQHAAGHRASASDSASTTGSTS